VADPLFLLDSNICIYVLADEDSLAARRLSRCERGSVVTSMISYAEVVRGIPAPDEAKRAATARLFDAVPPLPFDRAAADVYAGLPFRRARYDRLIAAHALSLGLILVTNNERDFSDIPALLIENWNDPA
jgi:tRNA(fMet)-specific endonuclease VapC